MKPSDANITVAFVVRADLSDWLRMRDDLWPGAREEHAQHLARFFEGQVRDPLAVLIARDCTGLAVGLAELSIRPYAEGCTTQHVGYLEGWYVAPEARGRGIGRTLVAAAEDWARSQGCREFASDTQLDNAGSVAAHRAIGFIDRGVVRCFSKTL